MEPVCLQHFYSSVPYHWRTQPRMILINPEARCGPCILITRLECWHPLRIAFNWVKTALILILLRMVVKTIFFQYQRFEMWFQKMVSIISVLLQPCDLRSTSEVFEDTQFDTVVFPKGTPMDYRYGFDYYRATYMYDWRESTSEQLSLGVGLRFAMPP